MFVFFSGMVAQDVFQVGQLFYTVTDDNAKTVKIAPENWPTPKYNNKPTGNITIPKTITHPVNSQTYTVTGLGKWAFVFAEITGVVIPNTVEKVDSFAFRECRNLKTLEFEQGSPINRIYRSMCEYCTSLEEIVIPPNVTVIEDWAFLECSSLETVTWSKELKVLYEFSFRDCAGLYDILTPAAYPPTFASSDPSREAIPGWVFYGTPISDIELTVPVGAKKNYTGYPWDAFLKINEKNIPASVKNTDVQLDITILKDGKSISISNLKIGETMQIFDSNGKLLLNLPIKNTTESINLDTGVYIVKIGSKAGSIIL
jgi:hypothetical protein